MIFHPGKTVVSLPRKPEFNAGKHWRAKLGFILMSTDLAAESDFYAMSPEGVGIHFTRLKTDDYTTNETLLQHIEYMADAASRLQPDTNPNVISYSCTSGSIVIGEKRIMDEIKRGAPHSIPMTLVTGVVEALDALCAKKIVVGTPLNLNSFTELKSLSKKIFNFLILRLLKNFFVLSVLGDSKFMAKTFKFLN